MAHYSADVSLSLGGDPPEWEGEVTVCYQVSWGAPERAPSYSHGGLPADPDQVDDITVTHIDGAIVVGEGLKEHAQRCEDLIETNDALIGFLLERAYEQAANDAWDRADYERDRRRDDALTEQDR
jgi:hypothetical protein